MHTSKETLQKLCPAAALIAEAVNSLQQIHEEEDERACTIRL